jgi:hypothetical protein
MLVAVADDPVGRASDLLHLVPIGEPGARTLCGLRPRGEAMPHHGFADEDCMVCVDLAIAIILAQEGL